MKVYNNSSQSLLIKEIYERCSALIGWPKDEVTIYLREKMWIQTRTHGYEFTADRIEVSKRGWFSYDLKPIEVIGSCGIHCSAYLLDERQLEELANLLPFE